jgi:hypothetical protein
VKEALNELTLQRDKMHKEVAANAKEKRDRHRTRFNAKHKVKLPNLMEGDYVLVASTEKSTGANLQVHWRGPRRIVSIPSPWTYEVEDLLQGKKREVHVSRVKLYRDRELNVTQALKEHAGHVEGTLEVDHIRGIRKRKHNPGWEVEVFWRGFEEADVSWEPLEIMIADVPATVKQYIKEALQDKKLTVEFIKSKEYKKLTGGKDFDGKGKEVPTHEVKKRIPRKRKGLSSS